MLYVCSHSDALILAYFRNNIVFISRILFLGLKDLISKEMLIYELYEAQEILFSSTISLFISMLYFHYEDNEIV